MPHRRDDDGARHAVRMLGLAQAAAFAVTGITVTIGPLSLHELSGREGLGGTLLAVFILAGGTGAFLAGRLMRRAGPRACLVAGHLLYGGAGVAAAAAGAAHAPRAILLAAVPLGLGHGAALLGRSIAVDLHPAGERGRAVGRILAVGAVGALSGPGLVAELRHVATQTGLDPHMLPWLAVPALGAAGAAAVSRLRVAPVRGTTPAPRPRARARRARGMGTATLVVAGAQASMLALMSVVPVHIHHDGGGDGLMALILGAHLAAMYGLAPLLGAAIDRWGHRDGLTAAAALCVAGAMLSTFTQMPVIAAGGLAALGAGWCASHLGVTAAAGAAAGPGDRASALGTADLAASITAAAAGVTTGLLIGVTGLVPLAWAVAATMGVVLLTASRPRLGGVAPVEAFE